MIDRVIDSSVDNRRLDDIPFVGGSTAGSTAQARIAVIRSAERPLLDR